jgi:hypothetical protein
MDARIVAYFIRFLLSTHGRWISFILEPTVQGGGQAALFNDLRVMERRYGMPTPPLSDIDAGKPPEIGGRQFKNRNLKIYPGRRRSLFDRVDLGIVTAVKDVAEADLDSSVFISLSLPENLDQDGGLVWFLPEIDDEVLVVEIEEGVEINEFAADAASVNAALAECGVIFIV